MSIEFRNVVLQQPDRRLTLNFSIERGVIAGVIGAEGAGKRTLLRLAAGALKPDSGVISVNGNVGLALTTLGPADPAEIRKELDELLAQQPDVMLIGPAVVLTDEEYQQYLLRELHRLQRRGAAVMLAANDLGMLERHCDEALLLEQGRIIGHGGPLQVIAAYRRQVFERLRARSSAPAPAPTATHGDGRAVIRSIRILGREGLETALVHSGEPVTVSVRVRFQGPVDDPVCGILIRSRVGITVYGTNTELENLRFGPCRDGDEVEVLYRFDCGLCPGEYTITAASHDPDGTAHEWLEEAVLFTIADSRYTAGVANLRAAVSVQRGSGGGSE